jgi:hypothetical protein
MRRTTATPAASSGQPRPGSRRRTETASRGWRSDPDRRARSSRPRSRSDPPLGTSGRRPQATAPRRHVRPRAGRRRALRRRSRRRPLLILRSGPGLREASPMRPARRRSPPGRDARGPGDIQGTAPASRWPVPAGQLAVAAYRPELVPSAVQEQEHLAGVRSRGGQPVRGHPASGHLADLHLVRYWMKSCSGGKRGAELFQCRRGLPRAGLLPIP